MKLSLLVPVAIVLTTFSAGCSSSDDSPPPPNVTPAPPVPPPVPPRALVQGTLRPASPANLLTDPDFRVSDQASYLGFNGYVEGDNAPFVPEKLIDSTSPGGFGGAVVVLDAGGGTDTSSKPVVLYARVPGGKGPFRAQVWFSKSDTKGQPVPLEKGAVEASLVLQFDGGVGADLAPVDGVTKISGGRTWVLYRATLTSALPFGAALAIRSGTTGGAVLMAAPEVTSEEIAAGRPVLSQGRVPSARTRPLKPHEREAMTRLLRMRPELGPLRPVRRLGGFQG